MVQDDKPVGLDALQVKFDDERAVSDAGVTLVATVAQRLGIEALAGDLVRLRLDRPGAANVGVVDVDSFVGEVHGYDKQGAAYGYTKLLGYHPILATRADTREVLHVRLRKGSANTQKDAALLPRARRARRPCRRHG